MNHTTTANGFVQKKVAQTPYNIHVGVGNSKECLQVMILSAYNDTVSMLLAHLSNIKSVSLCKVFSDASSFFYGAADVKAILFADAAFIHDAFTERIKEKMPSVLIVALQHGIDTRTNYEDLFYYINCPAIFGDVFGVINNAVQYFRLHDKQTQQERTFVLIKSEYRLVRINLADILFVEGMKDYVKIWLKDKNVPLTTLQNLKEFESKLPQSNFIRVHKSYIIALEHIDCIARNEIMIANHSIPVGDAFRNGLNSFISTHS